MKKRGVFLVIGILLVLAGVVYMLLPRTAQESSGSISEPATSADIVSEPTPVLSTPYSNNTYHFSVTMPDGYTAQEGQGPEGGTSIVLQDKKGSGIQILIASFDEDKGNGFTLTKERILQDVPDLAVADEQPVTVGPNYTGLAFKSDNPAFDGASREVWFVFRGNLYQISTYARLDNLLKEMFTTWKFE